MIKTLAVDIACTVNGEKQLVKLDNEKKAFEFALTLEDSEFEFAHVTYQVIDENSTEIVQAKFDIFEDLIYELSA